MEQGLISEADIDVNVRRILKARFELGMFDPEENLPWANLGLETLSSPEHTALANKAAHEAIVLLKNNNNLLPLKKDMKIAVVGPNADDARVLLGNYNGYPTAANAKTILDGIREAVDNHRTVAVCDGCVYGREDLVRQLFDACFKISGIKYSEKKVSFTVTNLSTIPVELVKAPGSENLTYARQIHINEEEVAGVSINGADSRKPIGMAEFDVHFKVINWLVDADTPLEVSYHFVMPAKYRK